MKFLSKELNFNHCRISVVVIELIDKHGLINEFSLESKVWIQSNQDTF